MNTESPNVSDEKPINLSDSQSLTRGRTKLLFQIGTDIHITPQTSFNFPPSPSQWSIDRILILGYTLKRLGRLQRGEIPVPLSDGLRWVWLSNGSRVRRKRLR